MKFPTLELNKWINSIKNLKGIFSVFGDFGVGKTTFALQTAIDTAKIGKNVMFVYTKPNFPSEKIQLIKKDSKEILDNIIFVHITNFDELYRVIFNFEFLVLNFLNEKMTKLNFIIIDSITNLYNLELNKDNKKKNYNRNYQLNQILANLTYLNESYGIEILIVNEISRKTRENQIIEVQSGGKVMEFWVKYNLKINKTNKLNERKFIFNNILEKQSIEFNSNLREKGFE
ncbi:MAG: PhoH family protein [Candidatus Lokiarchaeota archaeon]|nr:PhoH family protein [Candidatus Lokiarchaeota archaeon]